jgi:DNA polymerase III delta prime subunit
MGRYPLANSIYNDYEKLEKSKLTNDAIAELLENKNIIVKQGKQDNNLYTINQLDYAQEEAIKSLNIKGNLVIYGPPGTGKSQTIVNIISEALCKNKKVLVVSQKKAALDVVYNRLGLLNSKAMFLTDSEKGKAEFYDRVKTTHLTLVKRENVDYKTKYDLIQREIEREKGDLETISDTLFSKTSFGLTLQEMYANSYIIGKKSNDYETYKSMLKNEELMKLNYNELSDCLRVIKEKNKDDLYYKFIQLKKKNPLIDYVKPDIEAHILNESQILISKLINQRTTPFDMAKYKYSREVIAYAFDGENKNSENLLPLVKFVSATKYPKLHKMLALSAILFPTYPFVRHKVNLLNKDIQKEFDKTLNAIDEYITSYKFLSNVLTEKGYVMTLDNVLNGNDLFLKLLQDALNSYVEIREMNMAVNELTDSEKVVLKFAYKNSKNNAEYKNIINKLMVIRIYHEVVSYEDVYKTSLAKIMNYDNTRNRIISLINEQKLVAKDLCLDNFTNEYLDYYSNSKNNKDYLYQITKQQGLWPIRKIMENFGDYLFKLFPCWLLSPESVSTILPLKKNLFDIVLFDEASQVFIENTIPTIYRGKNIVVAGDSKQLRPTSTFIKRYLGNDNEDDLDLNTQAALEVESLLDLAQSRYTSSYLTYHYRSKSEELINFSNYAFYDGRLEIAPNISKNASNKPIERILVEGKWIDRKNDIEAEEVVALIKKVLKTRNNNQSIGIITFNIEQEQAIEDKIDEETRKDEWFRNAMLLERNRKENGEDTSIFVKNLENVQGDERDVIIFSIGYAKNEYGKVVARFGPLSIEGGENRLNVAITRAKEKIYVVTSIEPEELVVEGSKNNGPKLFKNYLKYVRAVSENRMNEAQMILNEYSIKDEIAKNATIVAKQIKEELESLGYKVDLNVGNSKYKISLGIYDNKLNTYLLGIECDSDAYNSSTSIIERDVYRPVFLSSRNWKLVRVWSRDWWLNKNKVIDKLSKMIEQNRQNFIAQKHNRKKSK